MDGLVPYGSGPMMRPTTAPLTAHVHSAHLGHPPSGEHDPLAKSPADYLRAIRRKIWLIFAIAVPIVVVATLLILRMPAVYLVTAEVVIEPPRPNATVINIVNPNLTTKDEEAQSKYVPDRLALLRSKSLVNAILNDPSLGFLVGSAGVDDPAGELVQKLQTRNLPNTHYFHVSLEGEDASRTTRLLNLWLDKFRQKSQEQSEDVISETLRNVNNSLTQFTADVKRLDQQIYDLLRRSNSIGMGGRSLQSQEYESLNALSLHKKAQADSLAREVQLRSSDKAPGGNPYRAQIENLELRRQQANKRMMSAKRVARNPGSDPAVLNYFQEIAALTEQIRELQEAPAEEAGADPADAILAQAREEIFQLEERQKTLFKEMKDSLPEYQQYVTLSTERDLKYKQINDLQQTLSEFEITSKTQNHPVTITVPAVEPTLPVRPKRVIYIAAAVIFAFGLGIGLVCLVEHFDHSVKIPEHLTAGLGLPLFGVVPWIHRSALNHKGGHLWVQGALDSREADAYRNLRASLLGVACSRTRLRTILITSAKSHEGKSTTALNLATTCARAGERTLLMDVDLRRSSLGDVFPVDEHELGLVDVLKGELPWQRTVISTDIPNLDFLPTGDTRGVPIEVLGSRELRQLLISLSEHHYDRIIIDGPAILGLADCRMLGRMVDASVLVVRSGAMELRPLQRAKAMLEQSKVWIAGVVFNGVTDDLQNWSSLAPGMPIRLAGLDDDALDAPPHLTALAGESH